jgi:hypothetical protein
VPTSPPELLEFSLTHRAPVIDTMVRLNRDRDGWLNLQPDIDLDDVPLQGPAVNRLFSNRGPAVPLISWVPGRKRKRGAEPTSLGLQHGGGPRAMGKLRDAGLPRPASWKVLGDHPKRGLVLQLPEDASPEETLDWVLRAAVILTTFELPSHWRAGLFHRR